MGYDLHITRKPEWFDDDGPIITPDEWLTLIDADPELSRTTDTDDDALAGAWKGETTFWFSDGEVRCKNPDRPTICKMVAIAQRLRATVQGDDGEVYREDGSSFDPESSIIPPTRPGILSQISSWLRHQRNVRQLQQAVPNFRKGQRVRDSCGALGTVLNVDCNANGGLGSIGVRMDDGRERHMAYIASGLEIVSKGE